MLLLQDGVLAFLSAVGLTTIVWAVAGALLHLGGRPAIPGLLLVLPLKGEALAMEADVRELRRVQGQLPGARLLAFEEGGLHPCAYEDTESYQVMEMFINNRKHLLGRLLDDGGGM